MDHSEDSPPMPFEVYLQDIMTWKHMRTLFSPVLRRSRSSRSLFWGLNGVHAKQNAGVHNPTLVVFRQVHRVGAGRTHHSVMASRCPDEVPIVSECRQASWKTVSMTVGSDSLYMACKEHRGNTTEERHQLLGMVYRPLST